MKKLRNLILLNCIFFIYGCESLPSFDDVLPDKRTTYKKSRDLPELEVPPDLTTTKGEYSSDIPSEQESTSLNEFERQRSTKRDDGIILGSGNFEDEQWVALRGTSVELWPKLREFWQKNDYIVFLDDAELGVLETDWKITEQTKQKFKILTEPSEGGGTILFISSERQELSEGDWLDSQSDKLAEKDIINKLNIHFNNIVEIKENRPIDNASLINADIKKPTKEKAEIRNSPEGESYLEVTENFSLVWDNTRQVLEQAGYLLEASDQEKGIYSFRYFKSEEEEEKSLFSRLKFWGDDENEEGILYQLSLISINNKTEIVVLNENSELQTEGDVIIILTTIKNLYNKIL